MLRVLGAARKREVKATQNLSIIVLFFVLCWFPLYTINCVQAFCPQCYVPGAVLDCCIILSHLNSAGNPLLYAYHLKDFRAALRALLLGPGPGADSALDFGQTGLSTGTSRTPLAAQRTCLQTVSPSVSPSRGPPPPLPLSTISNSLAPPGQKLMWPLQTLQTRYLPAPLSLTPSRSASDFGSDSGAEVGEDGEDEPRQQQLDKSMDKSMSKLEHPHPQQSPRSPKPRLSPLRAVGEFLFSSSLGSSLGSGCAWREDGNGKASSASTEPLDLDLDLDTS